VALRDAKAICAPVIPTTASSPRALHTGPIAQGWRGKRPRREGGPVRSPCRQTAHTSYSPPDRSLAPVRASPPLPPALRTEQSGPKLCHRLSPPSGDAPSILPAGGILDLEPPWQALEKAGGCGDEIVRGDIAQDGDRSHSSRPLSRVLCPLRPSIWDHSCLQPQAANPGLCGVGPTSIRQRRIRPLFGLAPGGVWPAGASLHPSARAEARCWCALTAPFHLHPP